MAGGRGGWGKAQKQREREGALFRYGWMKIKHTLQLVSTICLLS